MNTITQQQLAEAEARLEDLRKKREDQFLEVATFKQSLAIAESLLAARDGEIALAKAEKLQMERELLTKPRPVMTAAEHNAYPNGRY
jgi:hypothetical protein